MNSNNSIRVWQIFEYVGMEIKHRRYEGRNSTVMRTPQNFAKDEALKV